MVGPKGKARNVVVRPAPTFFTLPFGPRKYFFVTDEKANLSPLSKSHCFQQLNDIVFVYLRGNQGDVRKFIISQGVFRSKLRRP